MSRQCLIKKWQIPQILSGWSAQIGIAGLKKNILQKSINSYSRSAGADIIGLSPF
jgi:hypothetical protein